ncbi:DUF2635 domain-containing protein [Vibrio metschnikovii]|nr:DUF2635 domain-containing protein [Vibrio metschnikovii]
MILKPSNKEIPVRNPEGGFLSDEGEKVKRNSYWLRRIADGDVVEVKATADAPAKTKSTNASAKQASKGE